MIHVANPCVPGLLSSRRKITPEQADDRFQQQARLRLWSVWDIDRVGLLRWSAAFIVNGQLRDLRLSRTEQSTDRLLARARLEIKLGPGHWRPFGQISNNTLLLVSPRLNFLQVPNRSAWRLFLVNFVCSHTQSSGATFSRM